MPEVVTSVWWWVYWLPLLLKQGRGGVEVEGAAPAGSWLLYLALAGVAAVGAVACWAAPGGPAWGKLQGRWRLTVPGPRGVPVLGSLWEMGPLAHRRLEHLARAFNAKALMAFSLGSTRVVIASQPGTAREVLNSAHFADRPLKQSAQELMFGKAIGFAPFGDYWRRLRRIATTHLFAPRRIQAHEPARQAQADHMVAGIHAEAGCCGGGVKIRPHLQHAAVNNITGVVLGRTFDFGKEDKEAEQLQAMVREGFELLGAFNWSDHLPALRALNVDRGRIRQRCKALVPQVKSLVQSIIDEHRERRELEAGAPDRDASVGDFVDALLDLEGEEKLSDEEMIAVLWEMIFRGTDTTAILTEWTMAEIVLNPEVQSRIHQELDEVVGGERVVGDADMPRLPYLQAVIKETLRMHPPGPLLSWARLATQDVCIAGHHIPAGTTAMVNMYAITHDPAVWPEPNKFQPLRFLPSAGGQEIDIRGNDLRLAPFGAGRRVCPGRALGLATVQLWVARLLQQYHWSASQQHPVDLSEVLKLSCEMVHPLIVHPRQRLGQVLHS